MITFMHVLIPAVMKDRSRSFHDVIGFKKLGVAFEDTVVGRSYAAISDIEKVAKDRNFGIITCHAEEDTRTGIKLKPI